MSFHLSCQSPIELGRRLQSIFLLSQKSLLGLVLFLQTLQCLTHMRLLLLTERRLQPLRYRSLSSHPTEPWETMFLRMPTGSQIGQMD
jgi:hypothetical protein